MNADDLRSLQAPIKDRYRETPESAVQTMRASGIVQANLTCRLETPTGSVDAGLHPAAGGSGEWACSGVMLLQSLIACAGVTFSTVSTAMGIPIDQATISAEGEIDFRGTLGIDRSAPIGFRSIQLAFDVQSCAEPEKIQKLIELTERYCVIYQTLKNSPQITTSTSINGTCAD